MKTECRMTSDIDRPTCKLRNWGRKLNIFVVHKQTKNDKEIQQRIKRCKISLEAKKILLNCYEL